MEPKFSMRMFSILALLIVISACGNANNTKDSLPKPQTVVQSELELIRLDKNKLVLDADVIIRGTVKSQETKLDADGFPATDTTISVDEVFKGSPGGEVIVRTKGGEAGGIIYKPELDSIPQFKEGEEVVVFLTNKTGDRPDRDQFGYFVLGQIQGKFQVTEDQMLVGARNDEYGFELIKLHEQIEEITRNCYLASAK